jgi:hypothetical protein
MWKEIRAEVEARVENRYNLEGDAWVALEALSEIDQTFLLNKERLKYYLGRDETDTYYIEPSYGGVSAVASEMYIHGKYASSAYVPIASVPTVCLVELLRLANKEGI